MRISRIYTDQPLQPESTVLLDEKSTHYLSRVLKLRPGNPLVVFNGDGFDYSAEIAAVSRHETELTISTRLPAAQEPTLQITLVQAISRGERMDYCLQKATELGVASIQLLFTERVEVRLDRQRAEKRMAHWRGVIISACEQSGRAQIPLLKAPVSLEAWIGEVPAGQRLVLDPDSENPLAQVAASQGPVALLVGPEGGLSSVELEMLRRAGVNAVRFGPRVLRTETAGPAAIAVLLSKSGDL